VLAQASGLPADRAVITGARNFFRTSGGALGLAISTSVANNVFVKGLPAGLTTSQLDGLKRNGYSIPAGIDSTTAEAITKSYEKALHDVFIYFVPVLGVCLVVSFFMTVSVLCLVFLARC
jgi:hypothetical protein